MSLSSIEQNLSYYIDQHTDRLVEITRDLVRIPSENMPPAGSEGKCQRYVAGLLQKLGWQPQLYLLDDVPGLKQHPLFFGGRCYDNRPNLGARQKGAGGGRSLLLSGHVDTVPQGSYQWTKDPFGGEVDGNRLFGRGSNDMKAGVATSLFVLECLRELNIRLAGDLLFETVIDEEFGGVNGTLAGRLMGFNADAAIIAEPSFLRICPAQRGGCTVHLTLQSSGGVLTEGEFPAGVIEKLTFLLARLRDFAEQRRAGAKPHDLYDHHADPVPVSVTKIVTSLWGTQEPITIPEQCKIEIYWQLMPGETQENVEREFFNWLQSLTTLPGSPISEIPAATFPIRWLPGSAISRSEPLVTEFAGCATRALGKAPPVAGMEAPCDMYVFHEVTKTPAILWGGRGGNTHGADEYVEIDSMIDAAKALLVFVCQWCGIA
jgi:acetylornithine deacetylase